MSLNLATHIPSSFDHHLKSVHLDWVNYAKMRGIEPTQIRTSFIGISNLCQIRKTMKCFLSPL